MSRRVEEHRFRLEKVDEDKEMTDRGQESKYNPTHWAILSEKSYQGAHEMLRCITSYKKPANGKLSQDRERFKRKLESDRIIVENYFGRMHSLWNITTARYKWNEGFYDTIMAMCIALTNVHVDKLPLRADDGTWYARYMNSLKFYGEDRKRKRAETQAMYRARRQQRLRFGFRATADSDDATQPEH